MLSSTRLLQQHKQRVCTLYYRALKTQLSWVVSREAFNEVARDLRNQIEAHRHEADPRRINILVSKFEDRLKQYAHPDPYTLPTDPGGTKWERNVPVPEEACRMEAYMAELK